MFIDDIRYLHENDTHFKMIYNNLPYSIHKGTTEEPYLSQLNSIKEGIASNKLKVQIFSNDDWNNIIAEITGLQLPVQTMSSIEQSVRYERDKLLDEADIILLKYQEQVELGVITQDDKYRLALLQYKESLRNIPEQEGFPENVVWPELPARV